MDAPRISICIPAYRAEQFVRATVDSCLAQTTPAYEVILSDDFSSDNTRTVLDSYRGVPRVRIMYPPQHLGLGGHYRHVVEEATGSHVVILSSDDALHPRFLEDAVAELSRRPDLGLLAFGGFRCDARMRPRERFGLSYPKDVLEPPQGFGYFHAACRYLISFSVWRLDALHELPPLPPEAAITTDWYWALAVGAGAAIKLSRTPRGYYRMHADNASHSDFVRWQEHARQMLCFLEGSGLLPAACNDMLSCVLEARVVQALLPACDGPGPSCLKRLRERASHLANRFLALSFRDHPANLN